MGWSHAPDRANSCMAMETGCSAGAMVLPCIDVLQTGYAAGIKEYAVCYRPYL